MKKIILFLTIFLSSCATPYQPYGDQGGYEVMNISSRESNHHSFLISFCGNKHTNIDRAYDYALLRASELALLSDDKYFCVVGRFTHVNHTTSYFDERTNKILESSFFEGSSDYTISGFGFETLDKPWDYPACYAATEIVDKIKKKYWLSDKIDEVMPPTIDEVVRNNIGQNCVVQK